MYDITADILCDITADIDLRIAEMQEERDCTILYWFEMGETDRDYQLEIGFQIEPVSFEHF